MQEDISYDQKTLEENVDPYTGKQVKEGKSKAPLGEASESVAVGKPWSYALRGQCMTTGMAGSHDLEISFHFLLKSTCFFESDPV